jgi:2-oxoglutarate/2-oxoacid ferredoxin oxidoreductase subunit beta
VARSFSGDKQQLVPLLKAAMFHQGVALIDVISPCVTFNNTEGSTKSYQYVRDHIEATGTFDFIPLQQEILTHYEEGTTQAVRMHDGSIIYLHKHDSATDVTNRRKSLDYLEAEKEKGRLLTGILFLDPDSCDTHGILNTTLQPLNSLTETELCPGSAALRDINARFR